MCMYVRTQDAKPQLRHPPFLHNAQIYGKAEFLNPGGSVKDRVALQVVREALDRGELQKGDLITEGTAGSTGISLAMVRCAVPRLARWAGKDLHTV